jgi:hypothetical protein
MIELNSQFVRDLLTNDKPKLSRLKNEYGYIGFYFNIDVEIKDDEELNNFRDNWCEEHQFTIVWCDEYYHVFKYDDKYYKCEISDETTAYSIYPYEVNPVRKGIYLVYE